MSQGKSGGSSTGTSGSNSGSFENQMMSFLFGNQFGNQGTQHNASTGISGIPPTSQQQYGQPQQQYGQPQQQYGQPQSVGSTIAQGVGSMLGGGAHPVQQPVAPVQHAPVQQAPVQHAPAPASGGGYSPVPNPVSLLMKSLGGGAGGMFGGGGAGGQFNTPPSNEPMGPTNEELGYNPPTETPIAPTEDPTQYTGGQDYGGWYDTTPTYDPGQFDFGTSFDPGSMDFGGDFSF